MYAIQHWFICRPSDSTVSEDAGIEPRTVATFALIARRSITTRLDLIHSSPQDLIHTFSISNACAVTNALFEDNFTHFVPHWGFLSNPNFRRTVNIKFCQSNFIKFLLFNSTTDKWMNAEWVEEGRVYMIDVEPWERLELLSMKKRKINH